MDIHWEIEKAKSLLTLRNLDWVGHSCYHYLAICCMDMGFIKSNL